MSRHRNQPVWAALLAFALTFGVFSRVRADIAPPEQPPGTNILPGAENTQVRMMAETVILTVLSEPAIGIGQARTEGLFMMRNLGAEQERLQVRFPLSFWDGRSDGFFSYPEIQDFRVSVDGQALNWRRITAPAYRVVGGNLVCVVCPASYGLDLRYERTDLPWAAFDVTFPVGQDVLILVEYTTQAYGYEPYMALRYVLETGAGWKGTIGTADIVVRLPYDASPENVLLPQVNVSSEAAPSVEFSAQEVRWHFEDLEPTSENNIEVSLAIPSYWQRVVDELANVEANPQDGEAWGRLGKAYKEVVRLKKGQFRHDPEGVEMFARSVAAYERALAILPDEGLWQYELAELLYTHSSRNIKNLDRQEFQRALYHLNRALALAPTEPVIRALADDISANYPADVGHTEAGYEFYSLTATPIPFVTPPASRMPVIYPTLHPPLPTRTPTMIPQSAPSPGSPSPFGGIPICGAALLPVAGLFVARRKFAG